MSSRQAPSRRYESKPRDAQAAGTRRTIVDAATRLFIERGYGATSIDAIAAAAGVGRATVFTAVGGKAAILRRAYDTALMDEDDPGPLRRHPVAVSIRAEPDVWWTTCKQIAEWQTEPVNRFETRGAGDY